MASEFGLRFRGSSRGKMSRRTVQQLISDLPKRDVKAREGRGRQGTAAPSLLKADRNGATCTCWECMRAAGATPPANRTTKHRNLKGQQMRSDNGRVDRQIEEVEETKSDMEAAGIGPAAP